MPEYQIFHDEETEHYTPKVCLLPISINGHQTLGALDTGANISFLGKKQAVEDFGLDIPSPTEVDPEDIFPYTLPSGIEIPTIKRDFDVSIYGSGDFSKIYRTLEFSAFLIPLVTMEEVNEALKVQNSNHVKVESIRPLPLILGMTDFIERLNFECVAGGNKFRVE